MAWHAETSAFVLRFLPDGAQYGDPFVGIAFAKMLGPGVAFIEGALRTDGRPLTIRDWRDLARLLRDDHGVITIKAMRDGEPVEYSTVRA